MFLLTKRFLSLLNFAIFLINIFFLINKIYIIYITDCIVIICKIKNNNNHNYKYLNRPFWIIKAQKKHN